MAKVRNVNLESVPSRSASAISPLDVKDRSLVRDVSPSTLIHMRTGSSLIGASQNTADGETENSSPVADIVRFSPSLHPSESASQCGRRIDSSRTIALATETVSRFFAQVNREESGDAVAAKASTENDVVKCVAFEGHYQDATISEPASRDQLHAHVVMQHPVVEHSNQHFNESESVFEISRHSPCQPLLSACNSFEHDYEMDLIPPFPACPVRSGQVDDYLGSELISQGGFSTAYDDRVDFGDPTTVQPTETGVLDSHEVQHWQGELDDIMDEMEEDYEEDYEYPFDCAVPWATEFPEYTEVANDEGYDFNPVQYDGLEVMDSTFDGYCDMATSERGTELGSQGIYSASSEGGSSICYDGQFSQGRALLLGTIGQVIAGGQAPKATSVSRAEAAVAKGLKGHWLPQKY
jgi:hypothetical protein